MNATPPANFDLTAFFKGIYLFQKWELFPGITTVGPKDVSATMAALGISEDLTGKRILDIAPWNGFFSFECARRGAAEVIALGPEDPAETGFAQTHALIGADQVKYVRGSVYDLNSDEFGHFDIVLFLGLIYHLRHPLLALDRIFDVCGEDLFVDTPFIDNIVFDRTVSEDQRSRILEAKAVHDLPMLYYTAGDETGDPYNWFMPNLKAFRGLVQSSGFDVVRETDDGGGWCWLSAKKGQRRFTEGLEGYNPNAARLAI